MHCDADGGGESGRLSGDAENDDWGDDINIDTDGDGDGDGDGDSGEADCGDDDNHA